MLENRNLNSDSTPLEANPLLNPHLLPLLPQKSQQVNMNKKKEPNPLEENQECKEDLENNSWIAPGYDPMHLCSELIDELNGKVGQIDQASLYIDTPGALAWQGVSRNENYITAQNDLPTDDAIHAIREQLALLPHLDQKSLYILALGPGEAQTEVALVKKILRHTSIENITIDLLDISQPMLTTTYKRVKHALCHEKGVQITPCYGDFYKLHQYHRFLDAAAQENRLCLITMFGYTFGNLKNERRFVLGNLNAFPENTLLLMDTVSAFAPAANEEEVMKKDPWLSGESGWQEATEQFIVGPIRRYRKGVKPQDIITCHAKLDYSHCSISNSYCVELWATMPNQFRCSILYFKRYDPNSLLSSMESDGWLSIDSWPFGNNNQLLTLLRRI